MGKNLVSAGVTFAALLTGLLGISGVPAGPSPAGAPTWATQPDLTRWFKIHPGNPRLLAPPRGLMFFTVLAGYASPPERWLVETKTSNGWKVLGQTGASKTFTDEFGTGHGVESNLHLPFAYDYASEAVSPGDVIAMVFDFRGLLPGAEYRLRAQGFEFHFNVPLRISNKVPLEISNPTDPGFSCKKLTDRFASGTKALRVDADLPAVWRNMSNKTCRDLGVGVYEIRKPNSGDIDSVEYVRTDLLEKR